MKLQKVDGYLSSRIGGAIRQSGDGCLTSPVLTLSRIFGDDLAILPNVDRCAETAGCATGIQSRPLKSPKYTFENSLCRSVLSAFRGPLSISLLFCLNSRAPPGHPQAADRSRERQVGDDDPASSPKVEKITR